MELRGIGNAGLARALTLGPLAALIALTLLRLLVAAGTPLSPDEAYYWVWSRALAPGYLDHPPMVALWIRAGTALAGPGALGVRLLAPLAAALGSLLLAQAAHDLLPHPSRHAGLVAAALLNASILFGVGAVTMTPDTPLLFFWTAALWALGRVLRTGNGAWWLAAGAATGLALCSKYTAALLPLAVGLWLLVDPAARRRLARPAPWAGLAVAGLLFAPTLAWNARHGWASFARQGGRLGDWHPAAAVQYLAELVAGQVGLAAPLVFLLCAAGTVAAVRRMRRDPAWSLLAAITVVPTLVFATHALGDRVQANWPAIVYPSAAIAAAALGGRFWNRLAAPAVALGLALTLAVYAQALFAPLPLPRRLDPTLRLGGWPAFAARIEAARRAAGAHFVAAPAYGDAAELARLLPETVPVLGVDPRWAFFALPEGRAEPPGLLVEPARWGTADLWWWTSATPIGSLAPSRDGIAAETYRLYLVRGLRAAVAPALLPRP